MKKEGKKNILIELQIEFNYNKVGLRNWYGRSRSSNRQDKHDVQGDIAVLAECVRADIEKKNGNEKGGSSLKKKQNIRLLHKVIQWAQLEVYIEKLNEDSSCSAELNLLTYMFGFRSNLFQFPLTVRKKYVCETDVLKSACVRWKLSIF